MKKILIGFVALIGVLVLVVSMKTVTYPWKMQVQVPPIEPLELDEDVMASHLAEAVRFKTISHQDPSDNDPNELLAFHRWLQKTYPTAHRVLKRETINEHSLLYTWEGNDPSLEPVIFLAHMDVVPVQPGSEDRWTYPPFAGIVSDGFIWGRGTLDMKGILVGMMEAIEDKVVQGHQPRRNIMLSFGHDEEVSGLNGAAKIVKLLKDRGVRMHWVIDEGGAVTQGVVPGTDAPIAIVGIAEKGYLTLEVIAKDEGCHTSMPPYDTAVTRLAHAIKTLQQNPFRGGIEGPVNEMFDALGPELPFALRAALANRWLFDPLIEKALVGNPATNALLRTTVAPTMLQGSGKENVCPTEAKAWINIRIHPRDTIDSVFGHVSGLFRDNPWVSVVKASSSRPRNPSPVSPTDTESYKTIEQTAREIFPQATVVPSLVVVGTDSRHFSEVAEEIYRFSPFILEAVDLKRLHGTNERISVEGFADAVRFYSRLIDNIGG